MSDTSQQEAAEAASRAKGEVKAAAKDTARAVKAGAETAAEAVADEAKETAEKLEGTAQDAVQAARGMDIPGFLLDSSIGLGSLSLSLFFGAAAFRAFKNAPKNLTR
jgi:hypothetical protein